MDCVLDVVGEAEAGGDVVDEDAGGRGRLCKAVLVRVEMLDGVEGLGVGVEVDIRPP